MSDPITALRPYTEEGGFYHPRLQVSLMNNGASVSCLALVDSGADWCVFPESSLKQLGIEKDDLPYTEVSLVSGPPIPVHLGIVTLDLGFSKYDTRVGFHEGNLAVLGRQGFFDRWIVIFDTANKQFMVTNQPPGV
jgi:hypothetical protein